MSKLDFIPDVVQTIAGEDFTVYAYMTDGFVHLLDMKPLIERGGVFEKLKDIDFFKTVTVMNNTVAWDLSGDRDPSDCIYIDPCTIAECPVVSDPLEEIA